ncbi:MAG: hypothetical protein OHK0029_40050 [Armatimonadaceae bacterium]
MSIPSAETPLAPQGNNPRDSESGAPHIADTSYRTYEGPLQSHALRWWAVALATIKANVNRKKFGFWIIVAFVFILYLVQGIIFYVTNNASQNLGINLLNQTRPYATTLYTAQSSVEIWIFVAALTVGAASISADNRSNALLVYLSKPITRIDYLLGKWVGVFLLLFALTLVPSLLMYLFFLGTYYNDGFLKEEPLLFWKMLVGSVLSPAIHTSLILGISAWTKTPRLAGAVYAALYFIAGIALDNVARVVAASDPEYEKGTTLAIVRNAGIDGVGAGISMNLYDVEPLQIVQQRRSRRRRNRDRPLSEREQQMLRELERPPVAPLITFWLVYLTLPVGAAALRVRAVEVVKG